MLEFLLIALVQFGTLFGSVNSEAYTGADSTPTEQGTATTTTATTSTTTALDAGGNGWGEGH